MKISEFRRVARLALVVVSLFAIWLLLSGLFYTQYLLIGLLASLLIALQVFPWGSRSPFPLWRFLVFVPWQLLQVFLSNLRVAKVAISRQARIEPEFIRVKPGMEDERALAMLGWAITLTPGTLTVEIDADTMLVHALDATSASEIREGTTSTRVREVFERA